MTPPKYPNCSALGVPVIYRYEDDKYYVPAEAIEARIAAAPVVYDGNTGLNPLPIETWSLVKHHESAHLVISSNFTNSKRQARLLCVQPIVRDTADAIAKDLAALNPPGKKVVSYGQRDLADSINELVDRARKLLGGKGEGM